MYRYKLVSTGDSSQKYGKSEVYIQREERRYRFEHKGQVYEGWTGNGCEYLFEHKECLLARQRC